MIADRLILGDEVEAALDRRRVDQAIGGIARRGYEAGDRTTGLVISISSPGDPQPGYVPWTLICQDISGTCR